MNINPAGDDLWLRPAMDGGATTFAQRVATLRRERGITQVDAATAIGISRSYLAGIEAGKSLPGRETLIAIAAFYGVEVGSLTGDLPASLPRGGEFVEDPDELALLRFWRALNGSERAMVTRLMAPPKSTERDDAA